MMRVVGQHEADDHDKRVDDLLLFVTRTHNPLVHNCHPSWRRVSLRTTSNGF
jgi:hypothetical protein